MYTKCCDTYFDDTNYDVLQAFSFRIVVQYEGAIDTFGAAERGRLHARIDGCQVIVQGVQILQEILSTGAQHL